MTKKENLRASCELLNEHFTNIMSEALKYTHSNSISFIAL